MKSGFAEYKAVNDTDALERAKWYRSVLIPPEIFPIICYRTDRGETYGVLVNKGEKVIVWNAFTEKLEQYHINDYEKRFIATV
jgi:hypothetical protein